MPDMAVFCGSLIAYFLCMLLRYCLNDFETVPVVAVITGTTFGFTFHIHCVYIIIIITIIITFIL